MKALRVGLIGCGRIARRVHIPALVDLPDFDLVALTDTDASCLDDARKDAPGSATYETAEEMFHTTALDAVVIALPTALHANTSLEALRHGLHVYVEKPLATTLLEANRVVEAASATDRTLRVGLNFRFHPAVQALKTLIANEKLGNIVGVQTAFCSAARALPEWKTKRSTGGGALLDLASHHFDLIPHLLDQQPSEITAAYSSQRTEQDTASATMRFGQATAQIFVSLHAAQTDRIDVFGTEYSATFDRLRSRPLSVTPASRVFSPTARIRQAGSILKSMPASLFRALLPQGDPSFRYALQDFANAARRGSCAEHAATAEKGYESLALVLAAEEAATSGRPVTL